MNNSISINNRKIGDKHPPFVIAEISGNHNGSLERALEMVNAAYLAGANAVKLQTYTAESMTIDCESPHFLVNEGLWKGFKLFDLYKWAHTPYEWHKPLFDFANKIGITIFSSVFSEESVDFLEELGAPAYKISSFENTDLLLIKHVAKTGKPLIISTGIATLEEIIEAVEAAQSSGCRDLVLLHCVSGYPTPLNEANLNRMRELREKFGLTTGISDHTIGTSLPIAATALGASVIEKHFTLSRNDESPDAAFSLEPEELKKMCDEVNQIWSSLNRNHANIGTSEKLSTVFKRSIFFVKDLSAGSIISNDDIRRIRPGFGLAPKFFDKLIGKKLKVDVKKGMPTSWELFL